VTDRMLSFRRIKTSTSVLRSSGPGGKASGAERHPNEPKLQGTKTQYAFTFVSPAQDHGPFPTGDRRAPPRKTSSSNAIGKVLNFWRQTTRSQGSGLKEFMMNKKGKQNQAPDLDPEEETRRTCPSPQTTQPPPPAAVLEIPPSGPQQRLVAVSDLTVQDDRRECLLISGVANVQREHQMIPDNQFPGGKRLVPVLDSVVTGSSLHLRRLSKGSSLSTDAGTLSPGAETPRRCPASPYSDSSCWEVIPGEHDVFLPNTISLSCVEYMLQKSDSIVSQSTVDTVRSKV
jgi:hypothetical protein